MEPRLQPLARTRERSRAILFDARAAAFSLNNAQILGQASAVVYRDAATCRAWAGASGFAAETLEFFDSRGTQGFVVQGDGAIVVAFRGTQPNQPMDWLTDFQASHETWGHPVGKVHKGFYEALRVVWGVKVDGREILPRRLLDRGDRTVWITGHSLGGALAELGAAQASLVDHVPVQGVYTFGQPRVGDNAFASLLQGALGSRIFRFVNDKDVVPRVPLFSMGYCHYGSELFFDATARRQDHPSTIENLASALWFASRALNFDPIAKAGELLFDAVRTAGLFGRQDETLASLTEKVEMSALGDVRALFHSGAQGIEDHDMSRCYLARLGPSLPTTW